MGMNFGETSIRSRAATRMKKGEHQAGQTSKHRAWIVAKKHPEEGAGDGCGQRQNVGQIGAPPDAVRGYRDRYTIADPGSDFVGDAIGFRCGTEHPG